MRVIIILLNFIILTGIIVFPSLLLRKLNRLNVKYKFIIFLVVGMFLTAILSILFAWWTHQSNIILLKKYNAYVYNPDSGGYQVEYGKVSKNNISEVKVLETSIMGIGWPLKAIFMFTFFVPILFSMYIVNYVFEKDKNLVAK